MSIRLMTIVWDMADLSAGAKLVLLALADQANDQGTHCFPSVDTICRRCGQGERTVRRILNELETAGHITRQHRSGTSTQYRVHPKAVTRTATSADPCQNGTPAKMAPLPEGQDTPAKMAPHPCQNGTLTTNEPSLNHTPPPPGGEPSAGRAIELPEDWKVPPIDALPEATAALARRWPAGAYASKGEEFRNYWRGRGARRRDWNALWSARVATLHGSVCRDEKAGVAFTAPAGASGSGGSGTGGSGSAAPVACVAAKRREDALSADLRAELRDRLGAWVCDQWIEPVALLFDECGLTVVCPSAFHAGWIEQRQGEWIEPALTALGRGVDWIRFTAERGGPKEGRAGGKGARRKTQGARAAPARAQGRQDGSACHG